MKKLLRLVCVVLIFMLLFNSLSDSRSLAKSESTKTFYDTDTMGKWKYKSVRVNVDNQIMKKKVKYSFTYYDGTKPHGMTQIGNEAFLFDAKGRVKTSTLDHRFVRSKGRYFWVNGQGIAESGWVRYNNDFYYFSAKTFKAVTNKRVDNIMLGLDGKAVKTLDVKLKFQCQDLLSSITNPEDSMETKLSKAFQWMSSRAIFSYAGKYPDMNNDAWGKQLASDILETRCGNCYGFACGFAALAREIGYDPIVIAGRIHGSRDGAADGFTRHGFVMINGLYYDPELTWSGSSGLYAVPYCPFVVNSRVDHRFADFNGTRMPDDSVVEISKNQIVVENKYYHYYDKKGEEIFGVYYIDDVFYNFKPGLGMSKRMGKEYKKMIKNGAPFSKLRKKIGKPKKRTKAKSCNKNSKYDYVNIYKNVIIYTTEPVKGKEYITAVRSR